VLSGALSDGTFGLSVIKQHGGIAVVQDPDDAEVAAMPSNAIKAVDVDHVLPAAEIAGAIARLVDAPTGTGAAKGVVMAAGQEGPEPQRGDPTEVADMRASFGAPSALTCPDCGGVLWEVNDGRLVRYQCHVGHQYAPENLEEGQRDILDQALWSAVRVLEEQAELKTRMAARATNRQLSHVARGFETSARDARDQAQRLRDVLFSLDKPSGSKPDSKSG
jgi:two-component system chemotaxis response regulator CheB